ncbi:glycoside hydrolase family 35 protein [Actinacidiphila yanglinensis]|uniref:glycoside hydrolase family 35 protein n=1 Tax=Actinacidiphila yanglinensis TaxID=310779 RepID=UPI001F35896B|nr:glycoside hydrolase family 35 protein [Actinacidiphila yanglinensis]
MQSPGRPPAPILSHPEGELLRDGEPHRILAGSLHYFRVHPEQWQDRLAKLAALGLNTVDTYVPWNFHQPRRTAPRFDGPRDLERFLGLAQDTGLDVIVRPGPYICAEWDNGGLPSWLTGLPGMRPRTSHPAFLDEVARWFDVLVPKLAAAQAAYDGPVVAVQVENEYGSYGDDAAYLEWLRDALVARGISELLCTADGPTELMQDGGSLPGVLATATFGSRAGQAARLLRERRADEPFVCAEFWNGWFDHWGDPHHVRSAGSARDALGEILDEDGSVSLYMAHGGTNFGLWAGANHDGTRFQPTVTSYDSDAPIPEHGVPGAKFFALRERLRETRARDAGAAAGPERDRPLPPPAALLAPRTLRVRPGAGLLDGLLAMSTAVRSPYPLSFEELGQPSGLVLYRAWPRVPNGSHEVTVTGLHDRAQVFADGVLVGVLDQETGSFAVEGTGARVRLELLVENQGRINYGPLLGQGKGILDGVRIERRLVHGWEMRELPLDEWSPDDVRLAPSTAAPAGGAGFATASLTLSEPADTFLALPGFGKGFAWVNGTLLGRYWEIGPQVTLYVPAPLLTSGANTVTVLELERLGDRIELRDRPELGPPEEFVETFD